MALESACIPVPSEAVMLFAGFSVAEGELTLIGIIVAGVLGNLVGSWVAYAAGYYGRLDLLEKNRCVHVSPRHLRWADRLVRALRRQRRSSSRGCCRSSGPSSRSRRGSPGCRSGASPALSARRLRPLGDRAGLSSARAVGDNWEEWREHLHYLDYVVVAAVVCRVAYLIVRRRRGAALDERSCRGRLSVDRGAREVP